MKIIFITIIFCCTLSSLFAQSSTVAPLNDENHYLYNRLEIRTGDFGGIHSALKPLTRGDIRYFQDSVVSADYWEKNKRTQSDFDYLHYDNNDNDSSVHSKKPFMKFLYPKKDKSFLRHFYKTPAHLLEVRVKHFYANINPVFHLKAAYERIDGQNRLVFLNRRGVALRGHIGNRVYFYTDIIETQAAYPKYIERRINKDFAVPGAGYFKQYDSNFTPGLDTAGVDYLMAQGYIGVDLMKDHIGIQFGHGTNFIGDGHRSLFLSDYGPNYLYLKINTRVWKIHYQSIFAQLIQNYGQTLRAFDIALPKKYMAAHHLSVNILKNLNIGIFEGVVFSRGGQLDIQYLNPIIFYRSIEQAVGSPDNVVLGLNWKWNFLKHCSFYGQFLLDELSIGDLIRLGGDWWGNKFALQAGFKYIDAFGLDHLDIQAEFNMARPYTYSFRDSSANYTHYNQPLAHPLGANFFEWIGIINYQPMPRMNIRAQMNFAITGQDTLGSNWGTNPSISYNSRERELGNQIGQGVKTNLLIFQLHWSYQLRHNMYADFQFMYRREDAELDILDNNTILVGLGFRWNIAERMHDW